MCDPLSGAIIGSAVLGAGASAYSAKKAAKAQKSAQKQAAAQAEKQAQSAEEQFNRLNQKQPGLGVILSKNRANTSKGIGSTFLTGAAGVPDLSASLGGRPNLLGA